MVESSQGDTALPTWRRWLGRLGRNKWAMVAIAAVIVILLVGHLLLVFSAANSLEMESVRVTDVFPGSIVGDFTVVFETTTINPTSSSIEVERLTYDLYLDDEFIGNGDREDIAIEPGTTVLDFAVTFNIYDLPEPVREAFLTGSTILTIKGEMTVPVKFLGIWTYTRVTIPYEHKEEISSGDGGGPDNPPSAVLLAPPVYRPIASAELTWSRNVDTDFLRYEVHTSKEPDFVPTDGTKLLSIEDQNVTRHTAGNLQHLSTHYFILRVYDRAGQYTDSNRVSVFIP